MYPAGTSVTLTAEPAEGRSFLRWRLYDPNYPADLNHATEDTNNPITICMSADREVDAAFSRCGSGMGPLLPMVLGVLGLIALVRRNA